MYEGTSTATFLEDTVLPPSVLPSTLHQEHWKATRTRQSRHNNVQDWYNYRLHSTDITELERYVDDIFRDQTTAFKLNLSFGFVLMNNETGQTQYHHSSVNNNRVIETPFQTRNVQDIGSVRVSL